MTNRVLLVCVVVQLGLLVAADASSVSPVVAQPDLSSTVSPTVSMTSTPRATATMTILTDVPGTSAAVDIHIRIPVLSGVPDPIQRRVNAGVRSAAESAALDAFGPGFEAWDGEKPAFRVTSKVGILAAEVYSVELYVQGTGGNHPHYVLTRNYWLRDGGTVALPDLLIAPDYYEPVRQGILERLSDYTWPASGDMSDVEFLELARKRFLVVNDGILFVFNPCEIEACAAEIVRSLVPYEELRSVIDPYGAIGSFR